MKVLVLAPHAYYVDRGTPIDVDLLLRMLSARGDIVDAVVYPEGEDRPYPHLTIHRSWAPSWARRTGPGFSFKKLVCDVFLFWTALRLMRRYRYDVVHAGEEAVFFAMLFKRLFGVPYVYDMDSSIAQQMVEKHGFLRPLAGFFNACERRGVRGAIAVAPVCNALADLAREHGAARVVTLHDISQQSDEDFTSDGSVRRRYDLRGPVFMYVGNLERYQGVDLLLEAFAIAVKRGIRADLVIAGGTDEHIAAYRDKAANLGVADETRFIGRWPAKDLAKLLAEADVLAAPRIKGINTPMKVFPYMHSGKAVLVTRLPTHTQVLDDTVAMLAPADPEGFADAIAQLAGDATLRERLGAAGRAFVHRNHTLSAHGRRVDELYDGIRTELDRRSGAATR